MMLSWTILCSIGMEIIFAVITFLVALYSLKIYKIACQKEQKLFGLGFLSISFSYLIWFIMNITALVELKGVVDAFELKDALNLLTIGAYAHMILFLAGLSTLVFITFKTEAYRPLILLLSLSIFPILAGTNTAILFYSVSIILLLYIALHYLMEYIENKNSQLMIMMLSFLLLVVGTLNLIPGTKNYYFYLIGHSFSFVAYFLILLNLILVLKHGKKKK